MRLGIVDCDFLENPHKGFLNPDLMQIAEYYTQNNGEALLIPGEADFSKFDKIIISANRGARLINRQQVIAQANNVQYIGLAFTNGVKIELPEAIHNMPIYTKYYNKLFIFFLQLGILTAAEISQKKENVYMYFSEQTEINFMRTNYCGDTDIFSTPGNEKKDYLKIFPKQFKFYLPQVIFNGDNLEYFAEAAKNNGSLRLIIMLETAEEYARFMEQYWHILQPFAARIHFNIAYDAHNIYNGEFFFRALITMFKKIKINIINNYIISEGHSAPECCVSKETTGVHARIMEAAQRYFATSIYMCYTFKEFCTTKLKRKGLSKENFNSFIAAHTQLEDLCNVYMDEEI